MEVGALLSGKYRLVRLLGDGGMGAVYEARHEGLGSNFAVKILHADLARRPGLVDRFVREAHVSAQIKSPHVVQVFDVDRTSEGVAYIVMELLDGEPLGRVLDRERKLPVTTSVAYALQILEGLESAHALGVIHRDLKPENVFVTPSPAPGAPPLLKLIDFGIAKLKSTDPKTKNLTAFGVVMGTPEYMAPEQAFSADRADARSDVYAVGVMLYEMLAGSRPASGDEAQTVAAKVHRGEIVPLVHAAPHVPRELAGLVHRAMAPRPELRFASALEMAQALRAVAQHLGGGGGGVLMSPSPANLMASTSFAPPIPSPAPPHANMPSASRFQPPPNMGVSTGAQQRTQAPDIGAAISPGPPPYGYTPPPPQISSPQISYPEAPPRAPKRRSAVVWVIGIPLVLGAGVAAVAIAMQQSEPTQVPPPLFTSEPTQTVTPQPAITTPPPNTGAGSETLPPLVTGQPLPPNTASTSRPPTGKPDAAAAADGGTAGTGSAKPPNTGLPPLIPPFPSTFPSNLPFPFPSGIPLPSGFPPIPSTFPFPPPMTGGPPANSAGPGG